MIGWKPAVSFSFGLTIDSRMYASSTVSGIAGLQRHALAEQPVEHRPASLRVAAVAGVAREILEQLAARGRQRAFGLTAAQPRLELARLHDDDLADHSGMLRAAVLGAEQVIVAGLGRLEPDLRVAARDRRPP